uniref:Integrase catalytic domain-containing protein n=1 Tax=Clytia hemisphaerica TaxID=252671 RepID=A0A7M5V4P1_9CNID
TLRQYSFKLNRIAKILSVDRTTLWRRLKENGYESMDKWTKVTDDELDSFILEVKKQHPLCGEVSVIGFLRSKSILVQRWRVRESIHRIDPTNTALRWFKQNPRWVYSVPGPNSLWHNDGVHKLIHWGLVVHGCIDGFSRLATSLLCASNNLPETALAGFLSGVEKYGLPARVRGDRGGENVGIMRYMRSHQGYDGAYIQGPSVHNQRIERLNYDINHAVLSHFIHLFLFMEKNDYLDRNNQFDLFSLHLVFIPRIQRSLDEFREAWNHHPMSTEKNRSPYQQWLEGMMDNKKADQRGVRTYVSKLNDENDPLYGVDPISCVDEEDEPVSLVEVNDIYMGEQSKYFKEKISNEMDLIADDGNHGI